MKDNAAQKIKEFALNSGADVCGIASIDRFENAPKGFSPKDIFPDCKSVIAIGVALPKGLYKVHPDLIYNHFNYGSCPTADTISMKVAKEIEAEIGGFAVPMPSDGPYEYWNEEKLEGRGLISMKHAAMFAGIGSLGKNTLLINSKYGNRLTVSAVLTDQELEPDEMLESQCLPNCHLCIDSCPTGAISDNGVCQLKCRPNTYGTNDRGFSTVLCNKCRTVCPRKFGVREK